MPPSLLCSRGKLLSFTCPYNGWCQDLCADTTRPRSLLKAGQLQEQDFSSHGACYGKFTLHGGGGMIWMSFPAAAPQSCLPRKQTHSWEECLPYYLVSRGASTDKIAIRKCNVLLLVSECNFPAC